MAEIPLALNHGRIPLISVGNMGKSLQDAASGQVSMLEDVLPISLKCLFEPVLMCGIIFLWLQLMYVIVTYNYVNCFV